MIGKITAAIEKRPAAAALLATAVFGLSAWGFAVEFVRWERFIRLYALIAVFSAAFAAVGTLVPVCLSKKAIGKKGRLAAFFGSAALLHAVIWPIIGTINVDGLANRKAIRCGLAAACVLIGVCLILLFSGLLRRGRKAPRAAAAALLGIACFSAAFSLTARFFDLSWTYPLYRAVVPQGGVATADREIFYDFAFATQKTQPTDNLGKDASFDIKLAKNEREGFQLLVRTRKDGKAVRLSVSDFVSPGGGRMAVRAFAERYTAVPGYGSMFSDEFADALIPLEHEKDFPLEKDRLRPFYIETRSAADTPAGTYTATVTLTDANGAVLSETAVTAEVWDFTLPETPASDTAMGIFGGEFYTLTGCAGDAEQSERIYKTYYDYLLDHRVSPYNLPYDILDERADAYMSDPRVTSFTIPYVGDDALQVQYYEKVSSDPVWAAKGYFYPIDEPVDEAAYDSYTGITDRLARLCPGYRMVTPFCTDKVEIAGREHTSVSLQADRSSILCGVSDVVLGDGVLEEMEASRNERGSELWWYVCCGPTGKYNNLFIRLDGIQHRELFWQEKQNGLTGFLYWDSVYYDKGNPWETSKTWDSYESAGDGCLIYPGQYIGLDEPVGTLRLKNLTDGLEDYDYLTLAERKLGTDAVNETIAKITSSGTEYNKSCRVLETARRTLGEALAGE